MQKNINPDWLSLLQEEFDKPYFIDLWRFVEEEYAAHVCYPPKIEIFNAFNACALKDVKVVILGQDPYHGPGQANGLCFSVADGISHPPSLKNIFKEIESDIGKSYPESGNLERWAKQGVLLLNATLTVREHEAGSHQKKGWETFTNRVISLINSKTEGVVFLLWGGYAKQKSKLIDSEKHHILTSGHPSPLSANRGYWFGNKHFSKTNSLLQRNTQSQVNW
ncbi:uracil-DNA glycosylase [Formosa algae]|uniref:Uracil-DNA glycosylase n=1 Tax=Formosa algae TaxID=225843 RepID=A0A9X0YQK1_9FLAO|nr:uracil-DNA glycosylase [Formosa algae]MBP1841178.1 uracil-DNA glycosylase [Formosa algae]MDQ0336402.1 uracil-DNA glycosylase [Formosa algae]OEI81367.1 uracil-DNA glycosylase [Formosa algae]